MTAPLGFRAAGVTAGLKASGDRDVAVVINDGPSRAAAAVFTSNRVHAAPVKWSRQVVSGGRVRAVVLNSGGANACTGPLGFQDTHATAERLATALDDSAGEIAVCSTGLIGERLPMDKLLPAVDAAVVEADRGGGVHAADAIRTTDTVVKIAFRRPDGYTIGGMAKGAGMLAPALATMLVVLTTDADLTPEELDSALRTATAVTFDRLDSDGCMSTNDTVLLMASGASGIKPDHKDFTRALTDVCADLARQLQRDAEGASKFVTIEVVGAASDGAEAVRLAETYRPDVVLMDLRMPDLDGIAATGLLREQLPAARVLVLTTYADEDAIVPALRAGARGYLTKDASAEQIEAAIRAVHAGQTYLDPAVQERLVAAVISRPPSPDPAGPAGPGPSGQPPDGLTTREAEVLALLASGLSNAEIAQRLYLSHATVKTHINRIFAKTGARDRAQAVRYAYQHGLTTPVE